MDNVQRRDEKYWLPGQPEEAYVCVRVRCVLKIAKQDSILFVNCDFKKSAVYQSFLFRLFPVAFEIQFTSSVSAFLIMLSPS